MRERIARITWMDGGDLPDIDEISWQQSSHSIEFNQADQILALICEEIEKVGVSEQVIIDMVAEYHFSGQQDRHILAKNVAQAQLQKILTLLRSK